MDHDNSTYCGRTSMNRRALHKPARACCGTLLGYRPFFLLAISIACRLLSGGWYCPLLPVFEQFYHSQSLSLLCSGSLVCVVSPRGRWYPRFTTDRSNWCSVWGCDDKRVSHLGFWFRVFVKYLLFLYVVCGRWWL